MSPPADQAAQDIRKVVLKLFADFLSPDGKYVDYKVIILKLIFTSFINIILFKSQNNFANFMQKIFTTGNGILFIVGKV